MRKLAMIGLTVAAGVWALSSSEVVVADELKVPVGSQARDKQNLDKPRRGTSKEQVARQFGEPLNKVPAVGDPPISSWEYNDYIVFFEYNLALHTVLKTDAKLAE